MGINKKFGTGILLTVILSLSILFLPGTACTNDNNSSILEPVNFEKESLRFNNILTYFETVTSNPEAFLNDVPDGKVELEVLGDKFELEPQETHILNKNARVFVEDETGVYTIPAAKIKTYRGKVVGDKNSSAGFAVSDLAVIGSITTHGKNYAIEFTNKTIDNKPVLVVYSLDALKKPEGLERETLL